MRKKLIQISALIISLLCLTIGMLFYTKSKIILTDADQRNTYISVSGGYNVFESEINKNEKVIHIHLPHQDILNYQTWYNLPYSPEMSYILIEFEDENHWTATSNIYPNGDYGEVITIDSFPLNGKLNFNSDDNNLEPTYLHGKSQITNTEVEYVIKM